MKCLESFAPHPVSLFSKEKSINQSQLSALIAERLNNPDKFIGKPLVICQAVSNDGVQEGMLREVFKAHNAGKPKEEWKGFIANPKRAKADKLGLLFIDASEDYRESLERYCGLPVVVYAKWLNTLDELSADFPDAEMYLFTPDFEQWAECIRDYKSIPSWLIDFIRGKGSPEDITYRWYNYFNAGCNKYLDIAKGKNTGCDFPESWFEGLMRLRMYLKTGRIAKYCQVPEDFFNMCFSTGISQDLKDELREFLIKNDF